MGLVGRAWRACAARSASGVGAGAGRTSRRNHRAARRSRHVLGTRSGRGNWHQPCGSTAEAATVHGNNGYAPRSTGHSIYLSPHPMRRQSGLPGANGRFRVVLADRSRWGTFLTGDGHAVQGDGEVAGPALNCPMRVEMEFRLHPELRLALPRARQIGGWLTFGFGRSLDEAAAIATVEMVKLMGELYGFSPRQALSLASLVVDLRITQMVNGIRGVHALLRDDSIEQCKEPKA